MGLYVGETPIKRVSVVIESEEAPAAAITVDAEGIASKSGAAFSVNEDGILTL